MSREESGEEGERIKGRERKGERAREDGRKAKEKKALLIIFHLTHDCKMVLCD